MSIPTSMAAVVRKSAIDWKDILEDVGQAYDLWLTYLACREGDAAYYHPGRLTSYRVHERSATAQSMLKLHEDLAFCYDQFLEDERLERLHPDLRKKSSGYHVSSGAALLRADEQKKGCEHFKKALSIAPNFQALAGLILGVLPTRIAAKVLSIRRFFLDLKVEDSSVQEGACSAEPMTTKQPAPLEK